MPKQSFEIQGHRGARGLRPENTLPSFEAALDAGVTSIETDLHLTRDGVPVLCHDPLLGPPIFNAGNAPIPIARLTLAELRAFPALGNPDPIKLPHQVSTPTPLAAAFAAGRGIDPYAVPTLEELFLFAFAYAGEAGKQAGKTEEQRRRAARVGFDLELKRIPFFPEAMVDDFDGVRPGRLELRVLEIVHEAGVLGRTAVRSFDHRSVRILMNLEPGLTGGVLLAYTACVDPVALVETCGAHVFCPSWEYLDDSIIRRVQRAGIRILPWTVNQPQHWEKLVASGVDGLTTDHPDLLASWLAERGLLLPTPPGIVS